LRIAVDTISHKQFNFKLKEYALNTFGLLINGKIVPGDFEMPVINPATEQVIAQCPRASEQQLNDAVSAAKAALPKWSRKSMNERRELVVKVADIIDAHRAELARLLTSEQGKPLSDAEAETIGMASFFRYFGSLENHIEILEDSDTRRVEMHRLPLGVVGAIVPWNYPLSLLALKLPAALVAGNTVVLKPAPTTPLSTLRFAELVADIFPPGVLNVIADANDLGGALTRHPDVAKISFTGSTATGKKVMAGAADGIKRITLELGGNDAAIVLQGSDPKTVAPRVFQSAFMNNGQVCFAIKRLYVHDTIYDEMCDELAAIASATTVGDGMDEGTKLGPLQNKLQFEKVKELLDKTRTEGNVIAGGNAIDRPGYFIQPTIVRDISEGAALVDEEQFGPVLPVIRFTDVDDVIARANASEFGLGASVWSSDKKQAYDVARRIEAGTVWINKHLELPVHIPISGAKQSGIGVEQSERALHEFTQIQIINM
jgi:acyl-CoA reductase-like NAD-dependent aldehyde dehydrogenase